MNAKAVRPYVDALVAAGADVITDRAEIARFLDDNSWLSPTLSRYFAQLKISGAGLPDVDAVVSPASVAELEKILTIAVQHRVPVTVRGGGTTNFGQVIPLQGGIVVNSRRLNRVVAVSDDSITAEAGALVVDLEKAARARGRDLTLLVTTYTSATVGGWIGGGHVGIGTNAYGTIWDGNVLAAELLTAEDPPRRLALSGDALFPVLHTYGTAGVLTTVTLPLVPARDWIEEIAVFDSFAAACRFTVAMSREPQQTHRVVSAEEHPIPTSYSPLRGLIGDGQSAVLMIADREHVARGHALAREAGGTVHRWREAHETQKLSVTFMVYGHRQIWVKRIAPDGAFLHAYFRADTVLEQLRALEDRFGDDVWLELKYMKSPYLRALFGMTSGDLIPSGVVTVVNGRQDLLEEVMRFCDAIGVVYFNPHTFVVDESGLFSAPDFERIVAFKRRSDPLGLLNPGKIGTRFFTKEKSP